MRAILRLLGLIFLAVAFAAFVIDGTHTIAAGHVEILPLGDEITRIFPDALGRLRTFLTAHAPMLWDPVAATLLRLPGWVVFSVIALSLLLLGRPRQPVIGHGRR